MKDGGPAFPAQHKAFIVASDIDLQQLRDTVLAAVEHTPQGMSLRDYFAAHAPIDLIMTYYDFGEFDNIKLAKEAYAWADALLKERDR